MSPEISQKIAQLTAKAIAAISGRGPALTREESREAIEALRLSRTGAGASRTAIAGKPKALSTIDTKSILKGLGEMKK